MARLHVAVRLFSDRYHGSEWPPSPARLFQALVAGAKTGAPARDWGAAHEGALRWLENLGAPDILARPGRNAQRYTVFVPNNSLAEGKSTKAAKAVAPKILVDHSPGEADVIYRWEVPDSQAARVHLPALDEVTAHLRALGWGVDFAAAGASLSENGSAPDGLEIFSPDARSGLSLRVPAAGLLAHLQECHTAFLGRISTKGIDPYTRPTRFGQARYRRANSPQPRRWIAFELQKADGSRFAARWDEAQTVAAWLRHAAGKALLQEELDEAWVNSYIFGHTGPEALGHRLSFVPLPSIGHQHSDGGIRRVAILEPPSVSRTDAEALDLLRFKLPGSTLTDDNKSARAILVTPADLQKTLRFYVDEALVWETVTPMVLHGYNTLRDRISIIKTDRLLRQAFEAAGFPETIIKVMTFQRAPYWPGCEAAPDIRVPRHLAPWPRVHVRVEFNQPVPGPVVAGIGRHCGVGLFAARG